MRNIFRRKGLGIFAPVAVLALLSSATTANAASYTVSNESEWEFTVSAAETVYIYGNSNRSCSEPGTDPYLWLYNSNGALVTQNDDGNHNSTDQCVSSKIVIQLQPDTYTIRAGYCCSQRTLGTNPYGAYTYELIIQNYELSGPTTSTSTTTSTIIETTTTTEVTTSTTSSTTTTTTTSSSTTTTVPPTTTSSTGPPTTTTTSTTTSIPTTTTTTTIQLTTTSTTAPPTTTSTTVLPSTTTTAAPVSSVAPAPPAESTTSSPSPVITTPPVTTSTSTTTTTVPPTTTTTSTTTTTTTTLPPTTTTISTSTTVPTTTTTVTPTTTTAPATTTVPTSTTFTTTTSTTPTPTTSTGVTTTTSTVGKTTSTINNQINSQEIEVTRVPIPENETRAPEIKNSTPESKAKASEAIQFIADDELAGEVFTVVAAEEVTVEDIQELVSNENFDELPAEAKEAIAVALSDEPNEVKETFEEEVNVFEGGFDEYVPADSKIPVKTRRVLVVATTAAFILPSPRGKQ